MELDDQIREIQDESNDPYVAQRDFYLKTRQMEIDVLKGIIPDPLSRKNQTAPTEEAQEIRSEPQFRYEIAQLWYLPPKKTWYLAAGDSAN